MVRKSLGNGLVVMMLAVLFISPVFADDTGELGKRINVTNDQRNTPEQRAVFAEKVKDTYYVDLSVVNGLLKDFSPGETLVIISISNLSKEDEGKIAAMRKQGTGWPEIMKKVGVAEGDVINDIKKFQQEAGCGS